MPELFLQLYYLNCSLKSPVSCSLSLFIISICLFWPCFCCFLCWTWSSLYILCDFLLFLFSLSHFPHKILNHDTEQPETCEFNKSCSRWTLCFPGWREKRRSAQIRALFLHSSRRTPSPSPAQVTQSGEAPGCWDSHWALRVFVCVSVCACVWEKLCPSYHPQHFLTVYCLFSDFFCYHYVKVIVIDMLRINHPSWSYSSECYALHPEYGPFFSFCCIVHILCFSCNFFISLFSPLPQISEARGCQGLAGLHVWR